MLYINICKHIFIPPSFLMNSETNCQLKCTIVLAVLFFHADAAVLQRFVEELREIADQLEHHVVAQATQNLNRNILTSPFEVSLYCRYR